jgi:hypothetical protein
VPSDTASIQFSCCFLSSALFYSSAELVRAIESDNPLEGCPRIAIIARVRLVGLDFSIS